ncbi:MAG: helix-turn-helix domain-containing protein, partial [Pseudomonadota bacterium]|nr:helix-turn-helix domain-containing protein [Pseudomonadota bacterium]
MASVGALIGAPARASMVTALFDGRARTASELAKVSGVSAATASEHLQKLCAGKLIACERFGRFRYYKLAGTEVAELLEPLVHLVGKRPVPFRSVSKAAAELQHARMCYDHLAGRLGVSLTEAMLGRGHMVAASPDFALTPQGERWCTSIGIRLEAIRSQRRVFARQC